MFMNYSQLYQNCVKSAYVICIKQLIDTNADLSVSIPHTRHTEYARISEEIMLAHVI